MSQVLRGLQHLLPVVSIQVDAAEHVQLRVHPVQPAFDQICTEERKSGSVIKEKAEINRQLMKRAEARRFHRARREERSDA